MGITVGGGGPPNPEETLTSRIEAYGTQGPELSELDAMAFARMHAAVEMRDQPYDPDLQSCRDLLMVPAKERGKDAELAREVRELVSQPYKRSFSLRRDERKELEELVSHVRERRSAYARIDERVRQAYNREAKDIHQFGTVLETVKLLEDRYNDRHVELEERIDEARAREAGEPGEELHAQCREYQEVSHDLPIARNILNTYEPVLAGCLQTAKSLETVHRRLQRNIGDIDKVLSLYDRITLRELELLDGGIPDALVDTMHELVDRMESVDKEVVRQAVAQRTGATKEVRLPHFNPEMHGLVEHLARTEGDGHSGDEKKHTDRPGPR